MIAAWWIAAAAAQPMVVVAPFGAGEVAAEAARITREAVVGTDGLLLMDAGAVATADRVALAACGALPACAREVAAEMDVDAAITGELREADGELVLRLAGAWPGAPDRDAIVEVSYPAGDERALAHVLTALYPALGLPPDEARIAAALGDHPRPAPTPPTPGGLSARAVAALSFVPIPGFPSLYQRDLRRFGLGWAVAVPATGALVGVAGYASFRRGQLLGIGLAGYYASCVAANQLLGQRSRVALAAAPTPGGAVAGLTVPLR